jgi:hypothetical protein
MIWNGLQTSKTCFVASGCIPCCFIFLQDFLPCFLRLHWRWHREDSPSFTAKILVISHKFGADLSQETVVQLFHLVKSPQLSTSFLVAMFMGMSSFDAYAITTFFDHISTLLISCPKFSNAFFARSFQIRAEYLMRLPH